jgi:2-hydroxymuconate-semialdehyde hydrolase
VIGTPRHAALPVGDLAYLDEGEGPAVVMLHGFPSTSSMWREFVPLMEGRFRVIAPDLMGSGDSEPAPGTGLDPPSQTRAVAALLEVLEVDRFAIVGHGIGGVIAQLVALDTPGVDAMVLIDSGVFDPSASVMVDGWGVGPAPSRTEVELMIRSTMETGMIDRERLTPSILETYLQPWRSDDGPGRFANVVRALARSGPADRDQELGRIEFPVLILWGEQDPFVPVAVAERLNEAMPSSTLALLPGCGHFLPEEAPETIAPMIAEYLRARFLMEPHGHDQKDGVVMVQLERRPPWVDLAADEADDWFDVDEKED